MSIRKPLTAAEILAHFPLFGKFQGGPWNGQVRIMDFVGDKGSCVPISPTGTGKTPVEFAILAAANDRVKGSCFWIVPNKAIAMQIKNEFPSVKVVYGQNEYACPWAAEDFAEEPAHLITEDELLGLDDERKVPRVDEIPYLLHKRCPHYVDQETGETQQSGVLPCPYYLQRYEARQGGIVLCTMSFYLFTHLFRSEGKPGCLVIDEAHRIADVVRYSLSYDITDWHLGQAIKLLSRLTEAAEEIKILKQFLRELKRIARARKRSAGVEVLLTDDEIKKLMDILSGVDDDTLLKKIEQAVEAGVIDIRADRVTLKKLETLVCDIRRYLHSFEYSLEEKNEDGSVKRHALNYTCAFFRKEKDEHERVQYKLVIRCHYVAPLIEKRLLSPFTVSFSATIGDEDAFTRETGIGGPFLDLASTFPAANTRLYIPTDTPNLAKKKRGRQDVTRSLRRIARACVRFAKIGHRSLVVVISNVEREKFLMLAGEEGLDVLSYGNGITAKEAATMFRDGEGKTLVGTAAQYAEGIDLPQQMAPVIFFLRPGYPNTRDACTQFEERRYGGYRWTIWNWRVMQQALQVRGRNIRSEDALGVTFFISQQFKRVLYAALPKWLEPAYRRNFTFDQAVADAEKLLSAKE